MIQGQLVNAQVGRQLHPQSTAVAGGMTYRPTIVRGASEAEEAHTLLEAGSTPVPATTCPMPTKGGADCGGYPTVTGFCVGHSKTVAKVVGGLFGG